MLILILVVVTVSLGAFLFIKWPRQGEDGVKVKVKDIFTTDRVTSLEYPEGGGSWLVIWLEVENRGEKPLTWGDFRIELVTNKGYVEPNFFFEKINNSFMDDVPPGESGGGWLHFPLKYSEEPEALSVRVYPYEYRTEIVLEKDIDFRPWVSPLQIEILRCGRENGTERENFLYMDIRVVNSGENVTQFQAWTLDLNCTSGTWLDALFVPQYSDLDVHPGEVEEYRLYFDIPPGSPDLPKTLIDDVNGLYIDVDPSLYEGLI